jgi:hypothetical protein
MASRVVAGFGAIPADSRLAVRQSGELQALRLKRVSERRRRLMVRISAISLKGVLMVAISSVK